MKKNLFTSLFLLMFVGIVNAQVLTWDTYWGSNTAGSQIEAVKMIVDNNGNIYTASHFGGSMVNILDEATSSNASADKGDAIVVKMTDEKELLWKRSLVGSGTATICNIVLDNAGNVVVAGTFTGTLQPDETHSMQMQDPTGYSVLAGYVVRFDTNGNVLNMWQMPAEELIINGLSTDNNNNVIISGSFGSEICLNPNNLNEISGATDRFNQYFIAKYSANGNLVWSKLKQDAGASYATALVKADNDGSIYAAGTFTGTTDFAGSTFATAAGVNDVFMVKYDQQGNEQYAKHIKGSRNDKLAAIETSDFGDVAVLTSYYSEDITINGVDQTLQNGFAQEGTPTQYHIGMFTFNKADGAYRWWYSYGQGSTINGGGAVGEYLRCTDEGVWYLGGQTSSRMGDLYSYDEFAGSSTSGLKLIDGTWVQHNTNGGVDPIYLVLNREGKLCDISRPGGPQTDFIKDVAISPDKKNVYLLYSINVRDNVIYTCVNNMYDSYTDIIAFGRQSKYNLIKVLCPETPTSDNKYTGAYKGVFASMIIAKYKLPEFSPNTLPAFSINQAFNQELTPALPYEDPAFFQMLIPDEFNFDNNTLSGTFDAEKEEYFGTILVDRIAKPGEITYYASDPNKLSIRGNLRNVRYLKLSTKTETGLKPTVVADATFFPTVCNDVLNIKTTETNFTVSVYSQLGQLMGVFNNPSSISVNNLNSGLYIALLKTSNGAIVTSKFIVE